jgi:hypothetical protein
MMLFMGKKKDLRKMLWQYCRLVEQEHLPDRLEIMLKLEHNKQSSQYLGKETLKEVM